MGVLAIWRYPVKAMLGELLDAVAIGPAGCRGDRRWIVVDADIALWALGDPGRLTEAERALPVDPAVDRGLSPTTASSSP